MMVIYNICVHVRPKDMAEKVCVGKMWTCVASYQVFMLYILNVY